MSPPWQTIPPVRSCRRPLPALTAPARAASIPEGHHHHHHGSPDSHKEKDKKEKKSAAHAERRSLKAVPLRWAEQVRPRSFFESSRPLISESARPPQTL